MSVAHGALTPVTLSYQVPTFTPAQARTIRTFMIAVRADRLWSQKNKSVCEFPGRLPLIAMMVGVDPKESVFNWALMRTARLGKLACRYLMSLISECAPAWGTLIGKQDIEDEARALAVELDNLYSLESPNANRMMDVSFKLAEEAYKNHPPFELSKLDVAALTHLQAMHVHMSKMTPEDGLPRSIKEALLPIDSLPDRGRMAFNSNNFTRLLADIYLLGVDVSNECTELLVPEYKCTRDTNRVSP